MNEQNSLTLIDEETYETYECEILRDRRNGSLMYFGEGWYKYLASTRRLYVCPLEKL